MGSDRLGRLFYSGFVRHDHGDGFSPVDLFGYPIFSVSLELIGLSFPASVLGSFLGAALATPLGRIFQEKENAAHGWAGLVCGVEYAAHHIKPVGTFPKPGDPILFYLVMTSNAICAMGIGVLMVMIYSMIADVTDQHEEKHGSRSEGIYFAASSFAAKAIGGFGVVISGVGRRSSWDTT